MEKQSKIEKYIRYAIAKTDVPTGISTEGIVGRALSRRKGDTRQHAVDAVHQAIVAANKAGRAAQHQQFQANVRRIAAASGAKVLASSEREGVSCIMLGGVNS